MNRIAIVGLGLTPARAKTPEVSYREMIYAAARAAYRDAGIHPKEVGAFVTCEEDLNEGISIADEYTPDQLGAVLKPMHTVTHDGIVGLANAFMMIQSGVVDLAVVEAHSKASNILNKEDILHYALDPFHNRPLGLNPHFIAGLEMNSFLSDSQNPREACAAVAVKNKANARKNPNSAFPASLDLKRVLKSKPAFSPLTELEMSSHADGAAVLVVASEERAKKLTGRPVWVSGIGWCSSTPTLESRNWSSAVYAEESAKKAYSMAGISDPKREIDLIEVDDTYSYKELQHLEAAGIFAKGESGPAVLKSLEKGRDGFNVNLSGGSLGTGELLEAKGLYQIAEIVLQLRGRAGKRQVKNAKRGLALSWRGIPTTSGAAVVLSNQGMS